MIRSNNKKYIFFIMALMQVIDYLEDDENNEKAEETHIQKLLHNTAWREGVFVRVSEKHFEEWNWKKELEEDFPVVVDSKHIGCAVAMRYVDRASPYTNDQVVRHWLVRKVFPFSENHKEQFFVVPQMAFLGKGKWQELVCPMPMILTRFVDNIRDHNVSELTMATKDDSENGNSGSVYTLKAFTQLVQEDVEGDEGFVLALHAVRTGFPSSANHYLKCYGKKITAMKEGPATTTARRIGIVIAPADVGETVDGDLSLDSLEREINRLEPKLNLVHKGGFVGSWYHKVEGCELPQ